MYLFTNTEAPITGCPSSSEITTPVTFWVWAVTRPIPTKRQANNSINFLFINSLLKFNFTLTLYDTFGFPLDLTELILRENSMTVNVEEFDAEMQQQKQRARNAAAIETGDWIILKEGTTEFVGYDYTEYETSILRYRQVKQKKPDSVSDRTGLHSVLCRERWPGR